MDATALYCRSCRAVFNMADLPDEYRLDAERVRRSIEAHGLCGNCYWAPEANQPDGAVVVAGAKVPTSVGGVAIPQKRWRGWRDRQPKRNPVTIRHIGD